MTLPSPNSMSRGFSPWWRGVVLVLLATLCLSLQNILVKIAQSPKSIPVLGGLLNLGGYVTPDPGNLFQVPFLILLIRISFVVPSLWLILPRLHPGAFSEVKQIISSPEHSLKLRIVAAGFFLFLSQICIYVAISKVGPATAVTLFFIYPTVTTLLSWWLFNSRPSWQQWVAIALIYAGCTWLAFSAPNAAFKTDLFGLSAAVISGVVFALEGIIAQSCFSRVNPATFTGMVFTVEWLVLLLVTLPFIHLELNGGLLLMGGLLCCATLSGYLFNNFGIQAIGAAATAILGSSGPAVTALLGLLLLSDRLNPTQWASILLVTAGVGLMNLARLKNT